MSLKQKALSGVKWTSVSSILVVLIQLIQLAVLAHYLEPSDFGLMAIVYVVIGFSSMFMDMGISASIIHRQNITHIQLSSLYWLNVFSGISLAILVYILAPFVADFYNERELTPLMRLLALTFIISSLGNQYGIHLQKNLHFDLIAKISIVSTFTGFVAAIILAINGYGVYALAYSFLITSLVSTLLNIIVGIKEYMPLLTYKHKEIIPMISFGAFQMGERSINYFNSQFDVILIGKLLGIEALGIYTVAKNLAMRPAQVINPVITKVTFPIMSKVQNDTQKLKDIYLKTIKYLSTVNFAIYILLAILAESFVLLIFGEKWRESIYILQILTIYGAVRSTINPIGSLQLAKGRADLGFYWNLGLFSVMPFALYIGSFWGLVGMAYGLLMLIVLLSVLNWYFMVKPLCHAHFNEYFGQMVKPVLIAVLGGLFAYGVSQVLKVDNMIVEIMTVMLSMCVVVVMMNIKFQPEFWNTMLELVGKKSKRGTNE